MEKIKVVWICHFSNPMVRSKLTSNFLGFENFARKLLKKEKKNIEVDFAPWISYLINEFEFFESVDLHIIAPNSNIKYFTFEFCHNKIKYHFFNDKVSIIADRVALYLGVSKYWTLVLNRYLIARFIKKINPDIVNLFGVENPSYSLSALDIKNVPVYVLLQTVLGTPLREQYNFTVDDFRLNVEKKLLTKMKYFGTGSLMYRNCIASINTDVKIFDFWFPTHKNDDIPEQVIEYDFVFFASRVSNVKGIEDALGALSIITKSNKYVKMNIIGYCDANYKTHLMNLISELDIENNILFSDYFPLFSDMLQQVKKSKIAVLPNKLDVISSTIREAMFLKIPVVTTITSGTPYLNAKEQTVLLSKIGDINHLAQNMKSLLDNPLLSSKLVTNARKLAEQKFENKSIAEKMVKDYYAIIRYHLYKEVIPSELLFNISNYPEY